MRKALDADLEGEKVVVRTDVNLPIEEGEPVKNLRLRKYCESLKKLSEKGCRILVIGHQGRPGDKDFISLEKHVKLIEDEIGKEVGFVPSFFGKELSDYVASMEDGEVALLENVRLLSEELMNEGVEKHSKDIFVKRISRYFDAYVNDAFSVAHRPHGSMMGFMGTLDSYAGPLMVDELESCEKARDEVEHPVLVLGGAKPSDLIKMIERMGGRTEKILLGGVPGEIALRIEGEEVGRKHRWLEEKGFTEGEERFISIIEEHRERFVLPQDFVTEEGVRKVEEMQEDDMPWDIGPETCEKYSEIIGKADSVIMKGPMGNFEKGYEEGTRNVLEALANCKGFTLLGGGHTSTAVERFGFDTSDFSHVSIAGGAFVRFMSGEKLPVIEALEKT